MKTLSASARIQAHRRLTAASPTMMPELGKVMKALTEELGTGYKKSEHDGKEEVFWEFSSAPPRRKQPPRSRDGGYGGYGGGSRTGGGGGGMGGGMGGGGEHVLFAVSYDPKKDAMQFIFEGEDVDYTSPFAKTAEAFLKTLRVWAKKQRSEVDLERNTLVKLGRAI